MYYCRSKRIRTDKNSECLKDKQENMLYKEAISTAHDLCSDVWLEIFEYFETIELFTTFSHVTDAINGILLKNNEHFYSRGLVLDADLNFFSDRIPLHRIISLTLHEECSLTIINQCSKLRSLKLIGVMKWITTIIKDIVHNEIKLDQLVTVTPRVESLREFLMTILTISSLRRVEIDIDELEKNDMISKLTIVPSQIEQLILSSSSTVDCSSLFYMLSHFKNIQLLNIGLIGRHQKIIPWLFSQSLRTLSLSLLEVSFNWIIDLLRTTNSLKRLKLTGLVHDEDFIINEKWTHLFEITPFLARISVNLSLEQDKEVNHYEKFQINLHFLHLQLTCIDDDDYNIYYGNKHRWWNLKGIVIKSRLLTNC